MNNIIQTIRHTARAATVLLLALLAAQTAGAEDIATYYLDKDGTRHDVNATVLTGTEESLGSYGQTTWYVVNSDIQYTDVWIRCYGDINLILADGKTMTANNSNGNAISGPFGSLTIYGQTLGTGTLDATSNTTIAINYSGDDITINGGIVKATSTSNTGIYASSNLTINGGTVDAKGDNGLIAGNVTINSGNVTATGGDHRPGISANVEGTITINGGIVDAKGGSGLYAPNIAINGGKVTATATATGNYVAGIYADNGTITLGWTRASDFIQANRYSGTVSVKGSLAFLTDDATPVTISGNNIDPASINGRKLTPVLSSALAQDGDTYTINNTTGWDLFCDMLEAGETFSGKTVELANDITVTRMAGGQPFTGTFNGDGHTLTLAYGTADAPVDAQFVAPFVETASGTSPVFRNLTIDGTIYATHTAATDHDHVGGLIGHLFGTVTIEHCVSLVEIHAKGGAGGFVGLCEHSVSFTDCLSSAVITSPGGSNSGFVAWSRDSGWEINFTGCLFDGKLLQQNGSGASNGGFIGWKGDAKTVNITNCLVTPADLAAGETMATDGSATFSREHSNYPATIKNSYYTQSLGNAQGKQARAVTAGTDVTVAHAGVATHYATSGITAYKATGASADIHPFIAGLLYNNNVVDVLYAGSDEVVSLTLSNTATGDVPDGYQYGYTTNAGTLSGTGNPYTLTMPDEDVTISVNTAALAPIDWATVNEGDSEEDPYMIYNKDQLLLLAHRVNGTHGETANTYQGMYFKLGADITFSHDADETDNYAENYEAIGDYYNGADRYFRGTFDGANHTVSGIRIYKGGSRYADSCKGLFGCIDSGADIHDVHLTDARITGYDCVGGIVGYNYEGYIRRCTVTDSYITANSNLYYGTVCGWNGGTLTNNYYHGCTVNGTPVTSGVGCLEADLTDNNGALPAYAITLGENITTPPGTFVGQTEWLDTPPASPRLAPENGFTLAGNHFFASGYEFTPGSTLASGAAQGYTPRATLGGQLLDLYTPTGDADPLAGKAIARLTITADCDGKTLDAALRSTGQPVNVAYINADGTTGEASAIALDGTETDLGAGWYFVGTDIAFDHTLYLYGDVYDYVHLILADGKTMTVSGGNKGINADDGSLTIYGQTLGTGTLNATATATNGIGIYTDGIVTINGGTVNATGTSEVGIRGIDGVTINGGTVTTTGIMADGDVTISGGKFTATDDPGISSNSGNVILGWTSADDFIKADSYNGTVNIASGKAFTTDGTDIYSGSGVTGIDGKTLTPAVAVTLADGITATGGIIATGDDNYAKVGATVTVSTSGVTVPEGYTLGGITVTPAVTVTDQGSGSYSFTVSAANVSVSAQFIMAGSVAYVNEKGVVQYKQPGEFTVLTGGGATTLAGGWYVVANNISYTGTVTLDGDVHLILMDNAVMNVGTQSTIDYGIGDGSSTASISIYGQSTGSSKGQLHVNASGVGIFAKDGNLTINGGEVVTTSGLGIFAKDGNLTINGGEVVTTSSADWGLGIFANGGNITINGGEVVATSSGIQGMGIYASGGNVIINGGEVEATSSGSQGLGIYASGGNVEINGGEVEATGNNTYGEGIFASKSSGGNGGSISISNATVTATGPIGIHAQSGITINSGTVTANNGNYGIYASSCNLTINGGQVTAEGGTHGIYASNGNITISGGQVTADGSTYGIYGNNITLGWTNASDFIHANSYYASGTLSIAEGKAFIDAEGTPHNSGTVNASDINGKTLRPYSNSMLFLADDADNTAIISKFNGQTYNVTLAGRKLWKDGAWNTLCLPFAIADIEADGCPLNGATVRELNEAYITGTTLTLNFKDATTAIAAGTPYIVKWADGTAGQYTQDPVFQGVTIDATDNSYDNQAGGDTNVRFIGTYDQKTVNTEDQSILFLGAANTLYYPSGHSATTIGACRAYFKIGSGDALARQLTAFNFGFGEATGIITTNFTNSTNSSNEWYTLDGRKLQAQPTKSGLYIHGGRKVAIK